MYLATFTVNNLPRGLDQVSDQVSGNVPDGFTEQVLDQVSGNVSYHSSDQVLDQVSGNVPEDFSFHQDLDHVSGLFLGEAY
jgi:hypothetical protein